MTQLVRHLSGLSEVPRGGTVTIGNFDGVHTGHKAILQATLAHARAQGQPAIAVTFEPLPQAYFSADTAPPRLTGWREKFCLMAELGLDTVIMLPFDRELANWTADYFVRWFLLEQLGASHLIAGEDFRFGQGRAGNTDFLQCFPLLSLDIFPEQLAKGERISSTQIRQLLAAGEFAQATRLLGRPWQLSGHVVYGEQRGRQLGFPTANILLQNRVPVAGVYAVRVSSASLSDLPGVANVGTRPTVGGTRRLLEVYLPDFSDDIYGMRLEVTFCHKIRDECRFESLDCLKEQIAQDVQTAQYYFLGK